MSDAIPLSVRSFAKFYGIPRARLSTIIQLALRERSGVFGLEGLGYFVARMEDSHHMAIEPYNPTRTELETIPRHALRGDLASTSLPAQTSFDQPESPRHPPSASDPDAPSKYELELRILAERATALRQKNVLEQARLREETVSYCASAVQLMLSSLRSDIDSLRLDLDSAARLRDAIDDALSDLNAVLPAIISGTPIERIELKLSARRADRITSARAEPDSKTPRDPSPFMSSENTEFKPENLTNVKPFTSDHPQNI